MSAYLGILLSFTATAAPAGWCDQGLRCVQDGDLPGAIAAYRSALENDPFDSRAAAALAVLRGRVIQPAWPAPEVAWPLRWRRLAELGRPLGLLLAWYAAAGWLGWWWIRPPAAWRGWRYVAAFGGACLVAATVCHGVLMSVGSSRPWIVVAVPQSAWRQGNGLSYPAWRERNVPILLPAGTEGRLVGERANGWLWVEAPDGRRGWLPRSAVIFGGTTDFR